MTDNNILLIEDEEDLGRLMRQYLEAFQFTVTWCTDARSALVQLMVKKDHFDLLLIDVSMPDMSGFELTEKINELGLSIPFLFVTARNEKADRLRGLKLGADDYISKPFDIEELVLRIQNVLRRKKQTPRPTSSQPGLTTQIQKGDIRLSRDTLTLEVAGTPPIELTSREGRLLEFLFANENRIVKREELLAHVWGENQYFGGRSVDVFISRLRKYLAASDQVRIDNVYGVGFICKIRP